jgi:hypothetical protein
VNRADGGGGRRRRYGVGHGGAPSVATKFTIADNSEFRKHFVANSVPQTSRRSGCRAARNRALANSTTPDCSGRSTRSASPASSATNSGPQRAPSPVSPVSRNSRSRRPAPAAKAGARARLTPSERNGASHALP